MKYYFVINSKALVGPPLTNAVRQIKGISRRSSFLFIISVVHVPLYISTHRCLLISLCEAPPRLLFSLMREVREYIG